MLTPRTRMLFRAWMDRSAGDPEKDELLRELAHLPDEDLAELLRDSYTESYADVEPGEPFFSEPQSSDLLARIRATIRAVAEEETPLPILRPRWTRYVAAASIGLVLISGAWWTWFRHTPQPVPVASQQQRFKNDVAPGGDKAILTLANGQQIVLDSAANGLLAQQGNTTIEKNANGRLEYVPAGGVGEAAYNTLSTPRGGQYQLTLPDGTHVWLNTASTITYPTAFRGNQRKVTVTGEAYFEVAKDARHPFYVHVALPGADTVPVGGADIQVLGTDFNTNGYADEPVATITLVSGRIRIIHGRNSRILEPGQQAQTALAATGDDKIRLSDDPALDEALAWREGKFLFGHTGIDEIMRQVARWYDVNIIYEGHPADLFHARIPRDLPVSELLKLLELTNRVHFRIDGKTITVLP
jgi:transmembrane sensor